MIAVAVLALTIVLVYWFLVRPILRQHSQLAPFFAKSDLVKATLFSKVKLSLSGLKTVLFAKLVIIVGLLAPLFDFLGVIDWASILPSMNLRGYELTPSQYVTGILVPTIGWINLRLRAITTTPVGVPSADQVAAVLPDASTKVVEAKTAEIAEVKAAPSVASGKE